MVVTSPTMFRYGQAHSSPPGVAVKQQASLEIRRSVMRRPLLLIFMPMVAFVLHLTAYLVPVWFTFRLEALHKDVGLWFGRSCYRGKCHNLEYSEVEILYDLPVWFDVVRCLETVAIVVAFTVIACSVTTAIFSREYDFFRSTSKVMFCVTSVMAGMTSLVAVIIFYAMSNMAVLVLGPALALSASILSMCNGFAVAYYIYRYGYEAW